MFRKNTIAVYLWLITVASCKKSFTIVLDTTQSMQVELDVIKVNLGLILNDIYSETNIENYIIVPFDDDVQQPLITQSPRELAILLNTLTARGGVRCPENSLAGIERALQISMTESLIFVFTDAYSKDAHKYEAIQNLCSSTNSQVIIFLTGSCIQSRTSPAGNLNVYYDVATACSGAIIRLELSHLRQAFTLIKAMIEIDWTDWDSYSFEDYKQFTFSVDSFTTNVLMAVSGDAPVVGITRSGNQNQQYEKIVESKNTQVLKFIEMDIGLRTVSVRNTGLTSVLVFMKRLLPIQYGFSTKQPRSLLETAPRPIPGTTNYILINITQPSLKLQTLEIQVLDVTDRKTLKVEANIQTGLYMSNTLVDPNKSFRLWIHCIDSKQNEVTGPTKYVVPQKSVPDAKWIKPESEIIESDSITVDYGGKGITACKVTGYPKPKIWWEDENGVDLPSEDVLLVIPSVYISYATIENVMTNTTIYCKSQNKEGEDTQSLDVYFHRPYSFEMKQTPKDLTIEYGGDGTLFCEVIAYPEADTKWYHNDMLITEPNDLQITIEDNALVVNNMTLVNVGDYKCEVVNEANNESYTAHINISGIEGPKIQLDKSEVVLKLGEWSQLECIIIKGKPIPTVTWKYKIQNGFEFGDLPDGVVAESGKLKIDSAQLSHKGVYQCEAVNVEGSDSAEIAIELKYAPIIEESSARTLEVREGSLVALECSASGAPAPTVRWQMSRGDQFVPLDSAHHTDADYTHRFNGLWKDSGNYHCIAENDLGRAEKIVTVNVLVPVYIEPPASNTMVLRAGASVALNCKILFGNPAPSTRWEFMGLDSITTVLSRDNKLLSTLHLNNVSRINEGSYFCVAENNFSSDSIKIDVKVH